MKILKVDFDKYQRSRLKLTFIVCGVLVLLSLFPMYIINLAAQHTQFDVNYPWISWGLVVTTLGSLSGYYINMESKRPSLFNQNISSYAAPPVKNILEGEDFSDPGTLPI